MWISCVCGWPYQKKARPWKSQGNTLGMCVLAVGKKTAGQMCALFKNQTNQKRQTVTGERRRSSVWINNTSLCLETFSQEIVLWRTKRRYVVSIWEFSTHQYEDFLDKMLVMQLLKLLGTEKLTPLPLNSIFHALFRGLWPKDGRKKVEKIDFS